MVVAVVQRRHQLILDRIIDWVTLVAAAIVNANVVSRFHHQHQPNRKKFQLFERRGHFFHKIVMTMKVTHHHRRHHHHRQQQQQQYANQKRVCIVRKNAALLAAMK